NGPDACSSAYFSLTTTAPAGSGSPARNGATASGLTRTTIEWPACGPWGLASASRARASSGVGERHHAHQAGPTPMVLSVTHGQAEKVAGSGGSWSAAGGVPGRQLARRRTAINQPDLRMPPVLRAAEQGFKCPNAIGRLPTRLARPAGRLTGAGLSGAAG